MKSVAASVLQAVAEGERPSLPSPGRPILPQVIMGRTIALVGYVAKSAVGIGVGWIGAWLTARARIERWLRRLSAGIFGVLALRVAVGGRI